MNWTLIMIFFLFQIVTHFLSFFLFPSMRRCLATSAKPNEAPPKQKADKAVEPNQSFVANFFRGKVESSQVFPYPYNLTEEESETLSMVIDPVTRFFAVSWNHLNWYVTIRVWFYFIALFLFVSKWFYSTSK